MFGRFRRAARRTARRTSRRQARLREEENQESQKQPAYVAELRDLAALKEQGVISDAEFEAKKKLILGI